MESLHVWFGGRFLQISVASHGKGDIMVSTGHCHPSHMQPLSDAELCGVSMQHLIQSHIWPLPLFGTVPLSVLSVLLGPLHKPLLSSGGIGVNWEPRAIFSHFQNSWLPGDTGMGSGCLFSWGCALGDACWKSLFKVPICFHGGTKEGITWGHLRAGVVISLIGCDH